VLLVLSVTGLFVASCGGDVPETRYGTALNSAFRRPALACRGPTGGAFGLGAFRVFIAPGSMSPCANALSPMARAEAAPPEIALGRGEINATAGASAYTLELGERGFRAEAGAVVVSLPLERASLPEPGAIHPTTLLLRILDRTTGDVADATGTLRGDFLDVELAGLPAAMTAMIVHGPSLTAVAAPLPAAAPAGPVVPRWCVVYDLASEVVAEAAQKALGLAERPSAAQIRDLVRDRVAAGLARAQAAMLEAGFRDPTLYTAVRWEEPCAERSGDAARRIAHLGATVSGGTFSGRLQLPAAALPWSLEKEGATIEGVMARELLRASAVSHGLHGTAASGLREGVAAVWAATQAAGGGPPRVGARPLLLTDFLLAGVGDAAAANQDFFAYVGRRYADTLGYLADAFRTAEGAVEEVAADVAGDAAAALRAEPWRPLLLDALDTWTWTVAGEPLWAVYLEFLRQRAMEHGNPSQFGRTGEATAGFAADLFARGATPAESGLADLGLSPLRPSATHGSFAEVAPFAARALRVRSTANVTPPATLHISLVPDHGALGSTFDGIAYRGGKVDRVSARMTFSAYGATAGDEVVVLVANITFSQVLPLSFVVVVER
jgi:hypothetical protein